MIQFEWLHLKVLLFPLPTLYIECVYIHILYIYVYSFIVAFAVIHRA